MENFINVIFKGDLLAESRENVIDALLASTKRLDESELYYETYKGYNNTTIIQFPLHKVDESNVNIVAERVADKLFDAGFTNFDLEIGLNEASDLTTFEPWRDQIEAAGYTITASGRNVRNANGAVAGINDNGNLWSGSATISQIVNNPPTASAPQAPAQDTQPAQPSATGPNALRNFAQSGQGGLANDRNEREAIAQLQQKLIDLGYDLGPMGADGVYGRRTIEAVRAYQEANGLRPDGDAGPETIGAIVSGRNAEQPSRPSGSEDPTLTISPTPDAVPDLTLTPDSDTYFSNAQQGTIDEYNGYIEEEDYTAARNLARRHRWLQQMLERRGLYTQLLRAAGEPEQTQPDQPRDTDQPDEREEPSGPYEVVDQAEQDTTFTLNDNQYPIVELTRGGDLFFAGITGNSDDGYRFNIRRTPARNGTPVDTITENDPEYEDIMSMWRSLFNDLRNDRPDDEQPEDETTDDETTDDETTDDETTDDGTTDDDETPAVAETSILRRLPREDFVQMDFKRVLPGLVVVRLNGNVNPAQQGGGDIVGIFTADMEIGLLEPATGSVQDAINRTFDAGENGMIWRPASTQRIDISQLAQIPEQALANFWQRVGTEGGRGRASQGDAFLDGFQNLAREEGLVSLPNVSFSSIPLYYQFKDWESANPQESGLGQQFYDSLDGITINNNLIRLIQQVDNRENFLTLIDEFEGIKRANDDTEPMSLGEWIASELSAEEANPVLHPYGFNITDDGEWQDAGTAPWPTETQTDEVEIPEMSGVPAEDARTIVQFLSGDVTEEQAYDATEAFMVQYDENLEQMEDDDLFDLRTEVEAINERLLRNSSDIASRESFIAFLDDINAEIDRRNTDDGQPPVPVDPEDETTDDDETPTETDNVEETVDAFREELDAWNTDEDAVIELIQNLADREALEAVAEGYTEEFEDDFWQDLMDPFKRVRDSDERARLKTALEGIGYTITGTRANNYAIVPMPAPTTESVMRTQDLLDEETYDGDDFYEAYGDLWYNDDEVIDEAEYRGRKVKLGKPMRGDVKKFKVYVKNPKGNVVKVNFGDPNMKIKKSNPARRKSFRARHNCDNPGPRHKARYWSCRKW